MKDFEVSWQRDYAWLGGIGQGWKTPLEFWEAEEDAELVGTTETDAMGCVGGDRFLLLPLGEVSL